MTCSRSLALFELATLVVIGTDCIGSCKSDYHTITTTMAPSFQLYACELIAEFLLKNITFSDKLYYNGYLDKKVH